MHDWQAWLVRHRDSLKQIALPPELTISREHWIDFLQNGYLERHPQSQASFEFDQLSSDQMRRLLAVLESSSEFAKEPIVGWLRERLSS